RAVAMRVVMAMVRVMGMSWRVTMTVFVAGMLLVGMIVMIAMDGMLDVLALLPARLAPGGEEHEATRIEAGQQRSERAHIECAGAMTAGRPGALQDRILREEAGKAEIGARNADAGDGERAEQHRPESDGNRFPQAAIIAHVLLMMHGMDDRA